MLEDQRFDSFEKRMGDLEKSHSDLKGQIKKLTTALLEVFGEVVKTLAFFGEKMRSFESRLGGVSERLDMLEAQAHSHKEELKQTISVTGDSIVERLTEHQTLIKHNMDDISKIAVDLQDLGKRVN